LVNKPDQAEAGDGSLRDSFILSEFLPYLLNRAGVRIGLSFGKDIAHTGVTLPMWRVLVALWQNGDQRLGELSERTSIDISTLSRLLLRMQREGYVVRRRSGLDGRALSLTLTAAGREITEQIIPVASRYEDVAIRGMNPADVARLKRLLVKVYANIEALDARAGKPAAPDEGE
jgi:DNA-binding MarR family transcriptional regulator